jgi:hypothetical protein
MSHLAQAFLQFGAGVPRRGRQAIEEVELRRLFTLGSGAPTVARDYEMIDGYLHILFAVHSFTTSTRVFGSM